MGIFSRPRRNDCTVRCNDGNAVESCPLSIKDSTDPAIQMAEIIKIIKITFDVQLDINLSFRQKFHLTSSLVCTNVEATPTAANACSQQAQPLSNSSLNSNKALPSKMSFV